MSELNHIDEQIRSLAVPIDSVSPDPVNAKDHPQASIDVIAGSLREFGQVKPITVRKETMVICSGNGTWQAAKQLGWTHIAANVREMDAVTATKLAIADNRTAEYGSWKKEVIDQLMPDISFDDPALQEMMEKLTEEMDLNSPEVAGTADAEPEINHAEKLQAKWGTATGQLWLIGEHRLLCGDSTKREDVERVMGGERALLCNTDPPYGVAYSDSARVAAEKASGRQQRERKWEDNVIENDELDGEKLQQFLESYIREAVPHLTDNAAWYMWHPMLTQGTFFAAAAAAADILIHRQIIWAKPSLLFGFGDYHWQHELCFYGWRKGNRPAFYGERNQTTLWQITHDTSNGNREHPTQKPVELFIRPITNHTKPGEIIYEPFSGSGSQFVAAQNLNRRCFGIEISPAYCAVILQRMRTAFPEIEINLSA